MYTKTIIFCLFTLCLALGNSLGESEKNKAATEVGSLELPLSKADSIRAYLLIEDSVKNFIRKEVSLANYCEDATQCTTSVQRCPFGCSNFINRQEKARIDSLILNFESRCRYRCRRPILQGCIENKCVGE